MARRRPRPPARPSSGDLRVDLERIDGRPYGHYKDLARRSYALAGFELCFDHVQGDPFAAPSRVCIDVPAALAALPDCAVANADARRAAADFVQRAFFAALSTGRARSGSGKSGLLEISPVGQEVLERSGVRVDAEGGVRVRLSVGLPAAGRRILGREAARLVVDRLPELVRNLFGSLDARRLEAGVHAIEDQVALRAQLEDAGLVAFLAEGAVLARRSGADPRPLADAIPLEVPETLRVELEAPHAGRCLGLGIPEGVTLIVGGGYHGKSTLLAAIALGVYDHVPGDGRDACVSSAGAVSVRAEDGRSVCGVDLRPFIDRLPLGLGTERFSSRDASGSTSQAAAIVEALEAGARALLIDEDTAATNFMIRDVRMRRLIPSGKEPITPYLDRVRQLFDERGISSLLVVGGAGDYLDVADTVIQLDEYRPRDVGPRARAVAAEIPLGDAAPRAPGDWEPAVPRIPDPRSLDPSRGRRPERVRSVKTRAIEFGSEEIDVSLLFQLVDPAQSRAIGDALLMLARGACDGERSVARLLDEIEAQLDARGLEALAEPGFGDRARPRRFEIAAALNRLRTLRLA